MPLTVGGGVRMLEDIRDLLLAGADKVSIMTAAVDNRDFVRQAAEKFGSQCIVVAVDAMETAPGRFEVFTHGGRKPTGLDAVEWLRTELERRGIVMAMARVKQDLLLELQAFGLADDLGQSNVARIHPVGGGSVDTHVDLRAGIARKDRNPSAARLRGVITPYKVPTDEALG